MLWRHYNFKTLISIFLFLVFHQMFKRSYRVFERSLDGVIRLRRIDLNLGTFTSNLIALEGIPWVFWDIIVSSLKQGIGMTDKEEKKMSMVWNLNGIKEVSFPCQEVSMNKQLVQRTALDSGWYHTNNLDCSLKMLWWGWSAMWRP